MALIATSNTKEDIEKVSKSIRMDSDLVEKVNELARLRRTNFTSAINQILDEYFQSKK